MEQRDDDNFIAGARRDGGRAGVESRVVSPCSPTTASGTRSPWSPSTQRDTGVSVMTLSDTHFALFAPTLAAYTAGKAAIDALLKTDREPVLENGAIYTARITNVLSSGILVQLYEGAF